MGVHELLRVQVEKLNKSYTATNSLKFNKGFVGATQLDAQIHNNKALDHVCVFYAVEQFAAKNKIKRRSAHSCYSCCVRQLNWKYKFGKK